MKELLDTHRARLLGELTQAEAERSALKAKGSEVGARIGRIQTQIALLNTMEKDLSEGEVLPTSSPSSTQESQNALLRERNAIPAEIQSRVLAEYAKESAEALMRDSRATNEEPVAPPPAPSPSTGVVGNALIAQAQSVAQRALDHQRTTIVNGLLWYGTQQQRAVLGTVEAIAKGAFRYTK